MHTHTHTQSPTQLLCDYCYLNTPTSNMLKSHKNHRDDWPPFLLTASCEAPPPIPYHPISAEAEKNLSVCYILLELGMWSCHNHFKIGVNDPELLHYRSGKSKSIFAEVQNPCLQPP